ncbi:MAG TPA: hypothetical protein PLT85_15190, partial [Thauera aminoaromatica]|nr:hypothetical protein [Thauera aminoaromatica]
LNAGTATCGGGTLLSPAGFAQFTNAPGATLELTNTFSWTAGATGTNALLANAGLLRVQLAGTVTLAPLHRFSRLLASSPPRFLVSPPPRFTTAPLHRFSRFSASPASSPPPHSPSLRFAEPRPQADGQSPDRNTQGVPDRRAGFVWETSS